MSPLLAFLLMLFWFFVTSLRLSTRRMFWSRTGFWSLSFFLWMAVIVIWIWPWSWAGTFSMMFLRFLRMFLILWMMMLTLVLQGQKKKNFKNLHLLYMLNKMILSLWYWVRVLELLNEPYHLPYLLYLPFSNLRQSCLEAQAGLKLGIFLPQPPTVLGSQPRTTRSGLYISLSLCYYLQLHLLHHKFISQIIKISLAGDS